MLKNLSGLAMAALVACAQSGRGDITMTNFFNWETAPVHPVALSPSGSTLAVCNLPDDRVEIFSLGGELPALTGSVTVGLDPVTVRFRSDTELWVANDISGSLSVVDVPTLRVTATIATSNQPSDIVFAGTPARAFVSCGRPNLAEVFDPASRQLVTTLALDGERPRAMEASTDGTKVYAAFFESGNASTIISAPIAPLLNLPHPNAIDLPQAPSHGLNPPPNSGTNFVPAINPLVASALAPPRASLIVKKNTAGRWMDDNQGDWTDFISGTNAALTGRAPGWDLPDHDLAVIDANSHGITYVSGLMNICMGLGVNPASGAVTMVGTDSINERRFQPNLNGIFVRVKLAVVTPGASTNVADLNPALDYSTPTLSAAERYESIGDPRGIVWSADGTRGYVSGMGSSNIVILDATGARLATNAAIQVGAGPTGLALDEPRGRLYVYNRFDSSVAVVDTSNQALVATLPLFNPTPAVIAAGRPFLYDTHLTSGLGQAACASCHVDARIDRLAWDLGDPTSTIGVIDTNYNLANPLPSATNNYHPMKGPMTTLTLQDIIGHEPFHWRGDRPGLEEFSVTFTNLQGMETGITSNQMQQLKSFLATIGFPPNPYRNFDNSLATNIALPGQTALGRGVFRAGATLPNGNAQTGLQDFQTVISGGCTSCHTLPAGLGTDMQFQVFHWVQFPVSTNQSHHVALVQLPRSMNLPLKIPQLRNLFDKVGMRLDLTNAHAGFGFSHDGAVDTLPRFIQDSFLITNDQTTADLTAFLLSVTGSDLPGGTLTNPNFSPGLPSLDVPAATGFQWTLTNSSDSPKLDAMIALARTATNRLDLIVKGREQGLTRGWLYVASTGLFQSDRAAESETPAALRALAGVGTEQTYMLVPQGSGERIGIDRDADGFFDQDELDYGSNPADATMTPTNAPPRFVSIALSGPATQLTWRAFPGLNYALQYKNQLSDAAWTSAASPQRATSNTISFSDAGPPTNASRFYRLEVNP